MAKMTIKLYWHRGEGKTNPKMKNFGDFLSPIIVEAVSGKKVIYSPPEKANLFAIGSILKREKKSKIFGLKRTLHIWGSGGANDTDTYSPHHHYHAVRGPLTLSKISGSHINTAFGDPGLLSELIVKPGKKRHLIGIIPHYYDKNSPLLKSFTRKLKKTKFIDVFLPPHEVLSEISQCHFIISSSLHGLIIADTYKVPCIHVPFSKGTISEFKFHDYYLSTNREHKILDPLNIFESNKLITEIENNYVYPNLKPIQEKLINSFPKI